MPKILRVETNELNRDTLARWFIRRGYEVTLALLNPPLPAAPAP